MLKGSVPRDVERLHGLWRDKLFPEASASAWNVVSAEECLINQRPYRDIAEDLRAVVGPAVVLLTVRDQVEVMRSLYDMYHPSRFDESGGEIPFRDWVRFSLDNYATMFTGALSYADVVRVYSELFGVGNVVVISTRRLFEPEVADHPLNDVLQIRPGEIARYLSAKAKNDVRDHATNRRLAASSMRPFLRFLPASWKNAGRSIVRLTTPSNPTVVDTETAKQITAFYEGHSLADLKRLGAIV